MLPKIGDNIYIINLYDKTYRIGEIQDVKSDDLMVQFNISWILNPPEIRPLSYYKYRFKTYPTFSLGDHVIITFDDSEFKKYLSKICGKE